MKIGEILGRAGIEKSLESSRDKPAVQSKDFVNLLSEEMKSLNGAQGSKTAAPEAVLAAGVPVGVMSAVNLDQPCSKDTDIAASAAAKAAYDALGSIESNTRSSGSNLKALESIIHSLSNEAGELQQKVTALPDGHPLKEVGNELSVLAYVESVKWTRGDYL